jgi:putative membrane protein
MVVLGVFAVGAVCGILAFSRFLHWLLGKFHKETLIVLAGFIIGSLVKVWPWNNMDAIVLSQFPEAATFAETADNPLSRMIYSDYLNQVDMMTGSAILFALIGFFLVTGIEIAGKFLGRKKSA